MIALRLLFCIPLTSPVPPPIERPALVRMLQTVGLLHLYVDAAPSP